MRRRRLKPETYNLKHRTHILSLCCLLILLAACGRKESASLSAAFPGPGDIPGWEPTGAVELFDHENLYDLVDGQAEAYFAYAFEQVGVRSYGNAEGAVLRVEVWQLATPADAYGLFTVNAAGTPVTVGPSGTSVNFVHPEAEATPATNSGHRYNGDADPGRRLAFWQDRYLVQVRALQELDDAELRAFAEAVSAALPAGGQRPVLLSRLPSEGLVERSVLFFHEEISIQDRLWLGGQNLLELTPQTDGILARYDLDGAFAHLLLVQYPDTEAAAAGLTALWDGQISDLVVAEAHDNLLGAVFGQVDEAAASELLAVALGNGQSNSGTE